MFIIFMVPFFNAFLFRPKEFADGPGYQCGTCDVFVVTISIHFFQEPGWERDGSAFRISGEAHRRSPFKT